MGILDLILKRRVKRGDLSNYAKGIRAERLIKKSSREERMACQTEQGQQRTI